MHLAIKHKLLLLLLLSIAFSLVLAGITLVYFTSRFHDTEAQKQIHVAFSTLEASIRDKQINLAKNINLLARREEIIASVNMIDEYQDIENYSPLIFDIEKKHIALELADQAKAASIDRVVVYDSRGTLTAFCWKERGEYRLGIVSFEAGQQFTYLTESDMWDTWSASPTPAFLEEIAAGVPDGTRNVLYRKGEKGFIMGLSVPVIRTFPDGTEKVAGSIRMANIIGQEFTRQMAETTNLRLGLFIDSIWQAGGLRTLELPPGSPTSSLLFDHKSPDRITWIGHEDYFLHSHYLPLDAGSRADFVFGMDKAHLFTEIKRTRLVIIAVLALSALFVIPISFYIAEWTITKPITRLAKGVEALKGGIYDRPVKVETKDEMGLLGSSFNDMALTIIEREGAIRERERQYRNLFSSIRDVIIVADLDRNILDANQPAMRELFGYELEDIRGKETRILYASDEEYNFTGKEILDWDQAPIGKVLETNMKKKNGEVFSGEILAMKLLNEQGSPAGNLGIIRDITERKKTEGFIRNILESVGEGFIVMDHDYRIISANRAFCEQVNLPFAEVIGRHCYEISHHIQKPCFESGEECPVKTTFMTGKPYSVVHTHIDSEGKFVYVEIRSYPIRDPSGNVTSAIEVINDITEKKELEEQLRQSQKLQAIGTLTGGIAHDFNNLLTTIMGYGELLRDGLGPDTPMKTHVDMILAAGENAAALTQSLLAFSRKQILHPVNMNINDTVSKAARLFSRLIGEDINIKLHLHNEPLTVMADSIQIEQVLMNLATNARDAMPEGGSFIVSTEPVELDASFVQAHGFGEPGWYVMMSISDTGTGMDKRTRNQIFEPFFTTKEVGRGTGLGLSVVYGIIQQHKGYISVYSEPGKGTTFKVYLPMIRTREELKEAAVETVPPIGGTETVLVAEDDPEVRKFIMNTLTQFGYTALEARDGEDAVRVFREHRDNIQLILMDVIMPRKNGVEAFREITAERPDMKVLFVSGYPKDILEKYELADKAELINKPILPIELLRNVRALLDKAHAI